MALGFAPVSDLPISAQPAAAGVTVALTGVSSTTAVNSPAAANRSMKIGGGVATTSHAGSITIPMTFGVTGASSAEGVSKVAPVHTLALSGNTSTGAVGITGISTTLALSGNASTANVGSVSPDVTVAITGDAATGDTGVVIAGNTNITVGLNGVTATGVVGLIYFGVPPVLAEQTPTLIITPVNTVDVSMAINNVETSVSL